jgi:hypothetical protein
MLFQFWRICDSSLPVHIRSETGLTGRQAPWQAIDQDMVGHCHGSGGKASPAKYPCSLRRRTLVPIAGYASCFGIVPNVLVEILH